MRRRDRELARIETARRSVRDAEHASALAHAAAKAGRGKTSGSDAGAEFEQRQLLIARDRLVDATAAHARSDRWRRLAGSLRPGHDDRQSPSSALSDAPEQGPAEPADVPSVRARPALGVHDATGAYVRGLGPHDAGEDIHPHRLDDAESDLQDALSREELERRAALRDARDAI